MTDHDKSFASIAAAAAAGALFMYYLDAKNGARRRAMVRDKVVAAGNDAAEFATRKGQHIANKIKGGIATARRATRDDGPDETQTDPHAKAAWNEQGL
jgi:hypothetical protein